MNPKPTRSRYEDSHALRAVAFYTDIEHKKKIKTKSADEEESSKHVEGTDRKIKPEEDDDGDDDDGDEDEDMNGDEEYDEDEDDMDDSKTSGTLDGFEYFYECRKAHQQTALVSDSAVANDVVVIIDCLLKSGQDEVSFALQYLYRKSSVLPEFLKGSDSLLYQTLSKTFDVSLHAVVLHETTDYKGNYGQELSQFRAYKFDHEGEGSTGELEGSIDTDDKNQADEEKKPRTVLYMSCSSALEKLSQQDYVEYTGNQAILGDGKYFGGGMFVKLKTATAASEGA
jgi:hypothetical protein